MTKNESSTGRFYPTISSALLIFNGRHLLTDKCELDGFDHNRTFRLHTLVAVLVNKYFEYNNISILDTWKKKSSSSMVISGHRRLVAVGGSIIHLGYGG